MSTKRGAPRGEGRGDAPTQVESRAARSASSKAKARVLEPIEEKVVRMRQGLGAPDDLPLGRVGLGHPATLAKLQEIEARAFERSGRLDELRREAGLAATAIDGAKKDKIIAKLAKKSEPTARKSSLPAKAEKTTAKATAKATATATAKARPKAKR